VNEVVDFVVSFAQGLQKPTGDIISGSTVSISGDLGFDSLDIMTLLFELEERFGVAIPEDDFEEMKLDDLSTLAKYIGDRVG